MLSVTKPFFTEAEFNLVRKVLRSGWVVQGPYVKEFEERFARFVGSKFAIATTSCTTALHLALVALGISRGDEVIIPAYTFIATANAVEQIGAKPVFVDINPKTFNIDVARIDRAITKKTKAIIPVHLFGLSADMAPIMRIARKFKLVVIEDAACALGTRYRGRHASTFGAAGCFSFHPRKIITTGEGGMITTNNRLLAERLEMLRNHGAIISDLRREKSKQTLLPDYQFAGYNYRLTDIQAVIGIEQMKKLPRILSKRHHQARRYNALLKKSGFILPLAPPRTTHGYQAYVIAVHNSKLRDALMLKLVQSGIATRQGTHSVPHLHYYRRKYGYTNSDFSRSLGAEKSSLTLPLFHTLTAAQQKYIVDVLLKYAA